MSTWGSARRQRGLYEELAATFTEFLWVLINWPLVKLGGISFVI